jgi:predicted transcriptional regulator
LAILRALWQRGLQCAAFTNPRPRSRGLYTVLKLLQIMTEKGLVTRDVSARSHVYTAAASETTTQRRMVSDLAERAFGGSTLGLVLHALSTTPATARELDQVRKLLDEKRKGG